MQARGEAFSVESVFYDLPDRFVDRRLQRLAFFGVGVHRLPADRAFLQTVPDLDREILCKSSVDDRAFQRRIVVAREIIRQHPRGKEPLARRIIAEHRHGRDHGAAFQ